MTLLRVLALSVLVSTVSCRSENHHEEVANDIDESSEKASFVERKSRQAAPKNPLTAKLVHSVDKAIAENFEENVVTSWLRSDEGKQTATKAADMLTAYVNKSFGLTENEADEDEYSMRDLIGDFLKSQKKANKPKQRKRQKRNTQRAKKRV